jgi:hypothetical protein
MFKLPAIIFALVMGLFMSITITFCISLLELGFTISLLRKWFELWILIYPMVVACIIVYRPLALSISGKLILWGRGNPKSN